MFEFVMSVSNVTHKSCNDYNCRGVQWSDDCECFDPQIGEEKQVNAGFVANQMMMETNRIQNMRFSDKQSGYVTQLKPSRDASRASTDTGDTNLQDFFSRPIKILDLEWQLSNNLSSAFTPWQLYFTNPRVENRLTNYALLRADLHIKIVVNGNGFYYGRAMAAYQPNGVFDEMTFTLSEADLVQFSQMPKIMINPTDSTGGEMTIPFHWFRNNCQVDSEQIAELGVLWIRSLTTLEHANSGNDPVTVSVFAWAENVSLSALTSNDIANLTPQIGEEINQANSKGVVSGPATTIQKIAGVLSGVPYIGPYATATSMIASAVGRVATMFGYCKPTVTKAPEPYRPVPISTLALCNVPDVSNKLTVDHKQELTIDPAVMGVGDTDPLSITSIAMTESYLNTFTWNQGTAPESMLLSMRVDPCLFREVPFLNQLSAYYLPGMASAALPFKYWTGSLKFRFQFICSAFHKGRVKIVYDPRQTTSTEYNVNYMKIVDLAEENDVSITIGPSQVNPIMNHFLPGTDTFASVYNTSTALNFSDKGNGVLNVYVVNELTTPSGDLSPIEVAVYVSACEDFEVFVPDTYFANFSFVNRDTNLAALSGGEAIEEEKFQEQIGEGVSSPNALENPDGVSTEEPNAPQSTSTMNLGVDYNATPELNLMFTGEAISSFRTLLKRFNRWYRIANTVGGSQCITFQRPIFPFLRGAVPGAQNTAIIPDGGAGIPIAYNFANTVLIHWVTSMFAGWRGSIRYKILPYCTQSNLNWSITTYRQNIQAAQRAGATQPYFYASASMDGTNDNTVAAQGSFDDSRINQGFHGHEAIAYTTSLVNPNAEYEVPFYINYRYFPGKKLNWQGEFTELDNVVDHIVTNASSDLCQFQYHVAAGEDFTTFFYTGMPRVFYDPEGPDPDTT